MVKVVNPLSQLLKIQQILNILVNYLSKKILKGKRMVIILALEIFKSSTFNFHLPAVL